MADLLRLPGLVDVHTHLRVPGGEHKEDFASGTAAALAGGFTCILAMPNTSPPLATPEVLRDTRLLAQRSVRCDVGLFAGASPERIDSLPALAPYAVALKIYLNDTFGPLRVDDLPTLRACFALWPRDKMIAMHAEGQSVAVGIGLAAATNRPVHFCHISRQEEIELIAAAKQRGLPVTCEVTPHHLFLTEKDARRLGPLGDMRPRLATQADQDALWAHLASYGRLHRHRSRAAHPGRKGRPQPAARCGGPGNLTAAHADRRATWPADAGAAGGTDVDQAPSTLRLARPARHLCRSRRRGKHHHHQRTSAHPVRLDAFCGDDGLWAGAPCGATRRGGL